MIKYEEIESASGKKLIFPEKKNFSLVLKGSQKWLR